MTAVGRVDRARLVRLFQAARVFVYPSLYEGFGFPAAEALACGVPVITSDTSSLPEVVGDAGRLADPQDAGAIAAGSGPCSTSPAPPPTSAPAASPRPAVSAGIAPRRDGGGVPEALG